MTVHTGTNDGKEEDWCLILDHSDTSAARWVARTEIQSWLTSGSTGGDLPESLQTRYSRDIKTVRVKLERKEMKLAELKELSESFAAYKARAQTALKRVGK